MIAPTSTKTLEEFCSRFEDGDRLLAELQASDNPEVMADRLRELFDNDGDGGDLGQEEADGEPSGPVSDGDSEPSPQQDRDTKGRFTKGNKASKGNPFTRKLAKMRSEFVAAAEDDDVATLAKALHKRGVDGDNTAAALWLSYVVGKPRRAVDPDGVDLDEIRRYESAPTMAELLAATATLDSVPVVQLLRGFRGEPDALQKLLEKAIEAGEDLDLSDYDPETRALAKAISEAKQRRPKRESAE